MVLKATLALVFNGFIEPFVHNMNILPLDKPLMTSHDQAEVQLLPHSCIAANGTAAASEMSRSSSTCCLLACVRLITDH